MSPDDLRQPLPGYLARAESAPLVLVNTVEYRVDAHTGAVLTTWGLARVLWVRDTFALDQPDLVDQLDGWLTRYAGPNERDVRLFAADPWDPLSFSVGWFPAMDPAQLDGWPTCARPIETRDRHLYGGLICYAYLTVGTGGAHHLDTRRCAPRWHGEGPEYYGVHT